MKIGMLLDNEFYGDLRVENEVESLAADGHEVFVLCYTHSSKVGLIEDFRGAKIIKFPISKLKKNKYKGLINTPFDLHTSMWAGRISAFLTKYDIQALHAHDLYLLPAAIKARKKHPNVKLIADLHENYPEALKHYRFAQTFPGNLIISVPKWEASEKKWIKEVDYLITVIEEGKSRYELLGAESNKVKVVANYVNSDAYLEKELDQELVDKYKDYYTVTYIGGFDIHRGLESVIKSIPMIIGKVPNFKLVLIGNGINYNDLVDLSVELGVEDYVAFEGFQPSSLGASYLFGSDATIIPHLKTGHTDNTIPHKLFQYMLLNKPVLTSNCDPLARIVNETDCGIVFESNNEKDLAAAIIRLHSNSEIAKKMGDNGKQAVEKKYNWETTSVELLNLYKSLK